MFMFSVESLKAEKVSRVNRQVGRKAGIRPAGLLGSYIDDSFKDK